MNAIDNIGNTNIGAGIGGSSTIANGGQEYNHQWTPTHLASSSKQKSSCNGSGSRRNHHYSRTMSGKGDVESSVTAYPHPTMYGGKQTLSDLENANSIYPVVPPSSSSSSISHGFPRGAFEHEEKVQVRLVENRGLIVEESDDKVESEMTDRDDDYSRSRVESSRREYDFIRPSLSTPVNCLKYGNRSTCPGHSSKISSSYARGVRISPPPQYFQENECGACDDQQQESSASSALSFGKSFSRTRHSSASVGISSMTPLMTGADHVKDSHKIEVIVKSSSMKHQQGGSNIHLYCALVLGFSASLFFSLTLLLAKVLKNRDHHPLSIAFWRYLGILVPSVPLGMVYFFRGKKHKVVGSVWPIQDMDKAANALALLMRGVLGSTAVILRFCSLKYLTIGDSSVISYCAPVFAAILAPCCMKKDRGVVVPLLVGLVTAFGVFLVCRPPFLGGGGGYDGDTLKGVFLATLSMLCGSGVLIIVRNLLQKVHFSLMMFVLGIWGVFEAGVLAITLDVLKVPELLPDIVMMFGVAILTFFGQLFVLLAMRMGQVGSAVSVMRSCDIFLSFLWQYLFLKTEPEIFSILSAILIIFAVWFICFRKWLSTLQEDRTLRQRLSLLLY